MRRKFNFGKVDFRHTGRKVNQVEVEIELKENSHGKLVFTASGSIWNHIHTDCYTCGQCLDTIAKTSVGKNPTFATIYRLWKLYHLNDMHAGTPEQEAEVKAYFKREGRRYDYKEACEHLKFCGLYIVPHPETGEPNTYTYGHGWLYQEIPEEDLTIIRTLIETGELPREAVA